MKRSSILMGSYIFFILICFLTRTFIVYPMWGAVVAAVTFSSAFFSYADFFWNSSQSLLDICGVEKEYIKDRRRVLKIESETFKDVAMKIYSIPKEKFDTSEMEKELERLIIQHKEKEIQLNDYEKKVNSNCKRVKNYKFIGETLTFMGFLIFLCILVFVPITDKVVEMQDLLTVLAFAIILFSQLNGSIFDERLKQDEEKRKNAKDEYGKSKLQLEDIKEKIDSLVNLIKNNVEQ